MTTTKPVNLDQLQTEALALNGGHTFYSATGAAPDSTGLLPAGADLQCQQADGSLMEPCPAGLQAYGAHVAVAVVAGVDMTAVIAVGRAMAVWTKANPSGTLAQLATHLAAAASANTPSL